MREVRVRGTKEMVELCNPRRKMVSEEDFGKFWRDVYSFCCRMKRG
jgi:hypothetical protein